MPVGTGTGIVGGSLPGLSACALGMVNKVGKKMIKNQVGF